MEIETCNIGAAAGGTDASSFPPVLRHYVSDLLKADDDVLNDSFKLSHYISGLTRKYKIQPSKATLGQVYKYLHSQHPAEFPYRPALIQALIKKAVRSASGIINVSVVMPPDRFSCKYNCKFCPNETRANGADVDMPRSYLSNEDAVRRAASNGFVAAEQAWSRFKTLVDNGHTLDKIEYRILGGTFSCYDHGVADAFIRDLYYAANTYYDATPRRDAGTLAEEQATNVYARIHVVGVGVETRPDEITPAEILRFRSYGVTRVELGVQHTNDELLRRVNRGHGVRASRAAIKLLKDYGFKVEIHIMTDLPGATPEMDKECYTAVLRDDPDLIPDYMKDYPCLDVSFTEIKTWKADGRWTPYAERDGGRDLHEVLIYRQSITPPWVRVNRIQRDFAAAAENRIGFSSDTIQSNLAQVVKNKAEERGIYCQCIRCREIRNQSFSAEEIKYLTYCFTASGATEYYISAEVSRPHRSLLLGFIRLRLSPALKESIIPELQGNTAMIRELHVYGAVKPVGNTGTVGGVQHIGIGRHLLHLAESAARSSDYSKIAVISGIGVRDYYRKNGYTLRGTYMVKDLQFQQFIKIFAILLLLIICLRFFAFVSL